MEYIYRLLIVEIILLFISYSMTKGDILSPSIISMIMFIIATGGIIMNDDYWSVEYSYKSFIIVTMGLITMVLSEYVVIKTTPGCKSVLSNQAPKNDDKELLVIPFGVNFFIVCLMASFLLYYIYEVFSVGRSLGKSGLMVIGVTKYSEEGISYISRMAGRLITTLFIVYAYIVINNVIGCGRKLRYELVNLFPIIFGFCIMFFSGSRKLLVKLPIVILFLVIVITRDKSGRKYIKPFKVIKLVLPICSLIIASFYGMRVISKASTKLGDRTIFDYITYYISSPLYLFDKYIKEPFKVAGVNKYFGEMSFMGLYNSIGNENVGYNNFIKVGGISKLAGNEFSWFQRPYHDFGLLGMLVFTALIYGVFSRIYYHKIITKKNSRRRDLTIILYSYFYYIVVLSFYYPYTTSEFILQNILYVGLLVGYSRLIVSSQKIKLRELNCKT